MLNTQFRYAGMQVRRYAGTQVRKYASTQVRKMRLNLSMLSLFLFLFISSGYGQYQSDKEYHAIMDYDSLSFRNQIEARLLNNSDIIDLEIISIPQNCTKELELLIPIIQDYKDRINFKFTYPIVLDKNDEVSFYSQKNKGEMYQLLAIHELYPNQYLEFLHMWCEDERKGRRHFSMQLYYFNMDSNLVYEKITELENYQAIFGHSIVVNRISSFMTKVLLDNEPLISRDPPEQCCDIYQCLLSYLPGTSTSDLIGYAYKMWEHKDCAKCLLFGNPWYCGICAKQLKEDLQDIGEALTIELVQQIVDCYEDPCNNGGSLTCGDNQFCNAFANSFSILGSGPFTIREEECLDCPILRASPIGIKYTHPISGNGHNPTIELEIIVNDVPRSGTLTLKNNFNMDFQNDEDYEVGDKICVKVINSFCHVEDCFTIQDRCDLFLSTTEKEATECGSNDGEISLNVIGGSGNFTFFLGAEQNFSGVFSGLKGGTYNVTAYDNVTGCSSSVEIYLAEQEAPENVSLEAMSSCFNENNGKIKISNPNNQNLIIRNPLNPLEWLTQKQFENLDFSPATYNIEIGIAHKTNMGVVAECIISLGELKVEEGSNEPLKIEVRPEDITNTCGNDNNGNILFSISGGTPPYKIFLDNNNPLFINIPLKDYFLDDLGKNSGSKKIIVVDRCRKADTYPFTIKDGDFIINISGENSCTDNDGNDTNSGVISLDVTTQEYTEVPLNYSWSLGSSEPNLEDVGAGRYYVTVSDATGHCTKEAQQDIISPLCNELNCKINVTHFQNPFECYGDSPQCIGEISIDLPQGATVNWTGDIGNNSSSASELTGLCPGNITVEMTDGNCTTTQTFKIECNK